MRTTLASCALATTLLLCMDSALAGQFVTGSVIAAESAPQFTHSGEIVVLPVVNDRLDESGRLSRLSEETATSLRERGFTVRTISEAPLRATALRTLGGARAVNAGGIRNFAGASGIGALLLLALADARENEASITASIYASTDGVMKEVWRSRTGWRFNMASQQAQSTPLRACTGNLLVNGNFERHWSEGWQRAYGDIEQGASVTEVIKGADSHVLHLQHRGLSNVSVFQVVPVPRGRIFFQYEGKFLSREGPILGISGTGTAGLSLQLLGADKEVLGIAWAGSYVNLFEGMAFAGVPEAPRSTNSASFTRLPNGETVRERFNLTNFVLDRLGKVDVNRVAYVVVAFSVGATARNASAEAWVDNLALEVCPN